MYRLLPLLAFVLVPAALLPPGDPPARHTFGAKELSTDGDMAKAKSTTVRLDSTADDEHWPVWAGIARARYTELEFPPALPGRDH